MVFYTVWIKLFDGLWQCFVFFLFLGIFICNTLDVNYTEIKEIIGFHPLKYLLLLVDNPHFFLDEITESPGKVSQQLIELNIGIILILFEFKFEIGV